MTNKELAKIVDNTLEEKYPLAPCALESDGNPWKLLVMARLSAQCTDVRVNEVSRTLFTVFPTIESFANANILDVESIIKPCGLYRMKAKNIVDAARLIISDYNKQQCQTCNRECL